MSCKGCNYFVLSVVLHFLCFLTENIPFGQTAKIVVPGSAMEGMGHVQHLVALTAALVQRGHDVTLLSGSSKCTKKFSASNASQIISYRSPNETINPEFMKELAAVKYYQYTKGQQADVFYGLYNSLAADCRAILSDHAFLEKLKLEKFDFLIGDFVSPCDVFIAHLLDIPWIAVTANREYLCISNFVYRTPAELSYVPQMALPQLTDRITFRNRVLNVLFFWIMNYIVMPIFMQDFIDIKEQYNIALDMDLWEMSSKAELWLSQTSLVLDYPAPGMPNWVPVGGLAVRPSKSLPKDLEDFIAGSGEHGFIVFSLGSIIKFLPDAPETQIITSVLSKLPQRVVWKHDGPAPPNVGRNVKLLKWLPQNDLLGHPKARLYIGHGGLNGIYESIYHAVPMVLIPLMMVDQKENAVRVATKGMGIHLDRSKLTEAVFSEAVTKVLNDTSYNETVTRYSKILRDNPPLETAIFWIEHVLKFGGSHLRPSVYELNFIQYNLIDVAVFLLSIVVCIILLTTYSCRLCCRTLARKAKRQIKLD